MDLNQSYSDHQAAQMRANSAVSESFRDAFLDEAAQLAGRIGEFQYSLGAAAAAAWTAKATSATLKRNSLAKQGPPVLYQEGQSRTDASSIQRSQEGAARQKEMTRLALIVLGREDGLAFMNGENPSLGGRPIDFVEASEQNRASVEGLLRETSGI